MGTMQNTFVHSANDEAESPRYEVWLCDNIGQPLHLIEIFDRDDPVSAHACAQHLSSVLNLHRTA